MGISAGQSLSEFGKVAVALDEEMSRFEGFGRELEALTLESDKGMDRGSELLAELGACRERMEAGMRQLSRTLEQARERNERAERAIALRKQLWQQRQSQVESFLARFKTLGDSVRHLNAVVAELRKPIADEITVEEQGFLQIQLNKAMEPLSILVEEAKTLVQDARSANMKSLERNADSLRQTLQAARNRLNLMGDRRPHVLN